MKITFFVLFVFISCSNQETNKNDFINYYHDNKIVLNKLLHKINMLDSECNYKNIGFKIFLEGFTNNSRVVIFNKKDIIVEADYINIFFDDKYENLFGADIYYQDSSFISDIYYNQIGPIISEIWELSKEFKFYSLDVIGTEYLKIFKSDYVNCLFYPLKKDNFEYESGCGSASLTQMIINYRNIQPPFASPIFNNWFYQKNSTCL